MTLHCQLEFYHVIKKVILFHFFPWDNTYQGVFLLDLLPDKRVI